MAECNWGDCRWASAVSTRMPSSPGRPASHSPSWPPCLTGPPTPPCSQSTKLSCTLCCQTACLTASGTLLLRLLLQQCMLCTLLLRSWHRLWCIGRAKWHCKAKLVMSQGQVCVCVCGCVCPSECASDATWHGCVCPSECASVAAWPRQKYDVAVAGITHMALRIVGRHHAWHYRQCCMHLHHTVQGDDAITVVP